MLKERTITTKPLYEIVRVKVNGVFRPIDEKFEKDIWSSWCEYIDDGDWDFGGEMKITETNATIEGVIDMSKNPFTDMDKLLQITHEDFVKYDQVIFTGKFEKI